MPFEEVAKEAGRRWHALPENERLVYINRADDDRERFAFENENFSESAGEKKRRQDPDQPKKPMSAYLIFNNKMREELRETNPDKDVIALTKIVSKMWADLPDEDKKKWTDLAEADKERFQAEFKEYEALKKMLDLGFPPQKTEVELSISNHDV